MNWYIYGKWDHVVNWCGSVDKFCVARVTYCELFNQRYVISMFHTVSCVYSISTFVNGVLKVLERFLWKVGGDPCLRNVNRELSKLSLISCHHWSPWWHMFLLAQIIVTLWIDFCSMMWLYSFNYVQTDSVVSAEIDVEISHLSKV